MKKQYIIPIIAAFFFNSSTVTAYGGSAEGTIETTLDDMTADYSVRYNDNAPGQWVKVSYSSQDRTFWFSNHAWFMCKVTPESALYEEAIKIALNFKNGSTLFASKPPGFSDYNCSDIDIELNTVKMGAEEILIP